MKKNLSRLLSMLLCLVLVLSVVPTAAFAAETDEGLVEEEELVVESAVSNAKPKITSSPSSKTWAKGSTAKFTVKASGTNLKYQWYYRTSSSGSWKKCTLTGNKTATLKVTATTARNGYQYRCKVSNGSGYVYSKAAKLTVTSAIKITTQPTSKTVKQGNTTKFTVKTNCEGLTYQWQYRTSSSGSWKKATATGNKTATLKLTATAARDGYQYRCKISNGTKTVYSNAAKLTVNKVTYRALLVGEVNFYYRSDICGRNKGDVQRIAAALKSVKGGKGNPYETIACKYDLDNDGIKNAISSTFAGADSNDVSLFFIATHGDVSSYYDQYDWAGALLTVAYPEDDFLRLGDLADWLSAVPGKVIVVLGSCGSGTAIEPLPNGVTAQNAPRLFNEAVIKAFSAKNSFVADDDDTVANMGEFRNSKFYVLTAADYMESSWGRETSDHDPEYSFNFFPLYFAAGAQGYADYNGNGNVTLQEMYDYTYENSYGPYNGSYYQHVQVYPENSSYILFKY